MRGVTVSDTVNSVESYVREHGDMNPDIAVKVNELMHAFNELFNTTIQESVAPGPYLSPNQIFAKEMVSDIAPILANFYAEIPQQPIEETVDPNVEFANKLNREAWGVDYYIKNDKGNYIKNPDALILHQQQYQVDKLYQEVDVNFYAKGLGVPDNFKRKFASPLAKLIHVKYDVKESIFHVRLPKRYVNYVNTMVSRNMSGEEILDLYYSLIDTWWGTNRLNQDIREITRGVGIGAMAAGIAGASSPLGVAAIIAGGGAIVHSLFERSSLWLFVKQLLFYTLIDERTNEKSIAGLNLEFIKYPYKKIMERLTHKNWHERVKPWLSFEIYMRGDDEYRKNVPANDSIVSMTEYNRLLNWDRATMLCKSRVIPEIYDETREYIHPKTLDVHDIKTGELLREGLAYLKPQDEVVEEATTPVKTETFPFTYKNKKKEAIVITKAVLEKLENVKYRFEKPNPDLMGDGSYKLYSTPDRTDVDCCWYAVWSPDKTRDQQILEYHAERANIDAIDFDAQDKLYLEEALSYLEGDNKPIQEKTIDELADGAMTNIDRLFTKRESINKLENCR
jgi:hypothetical protein